MMQWYCLYRVTSGTMSPLFYTTSLDDAFSYPSSDEASRAVSYRIEPVSRTKLEDEKPEPKPVSPLKYDDHHLREVEVKVVKDKPARSVPPPSIPHPEPVSDPKKRPDNYVP